MSTRLISTILFAAGAIAGAVGADRWLFVPPDLRSDSNGKLTAETEASRLPDDRTSRSARLQPAAESTSLLIVERRSVLDSLASAAETDPQSALSTALAIDDLAVRLTAVRSIAAAWARLDPIAAMAEAARLPNEMRSDFQSAVSEAWAFIDPVRFLQFAETSTSIAPLTAGLEVLIASDPIRVLELSGDSALWVDNRVIRVFFSAVGDLVRSDPDAALSLIEPRVPPSLREGVLAEIAKSYAETDGRAALEWATSLEPPIPWVVEQVLVTSAEGDFLEAIDMAVEAAAGLPLDRNVLMHIADTAYRAGQDPVALLDALERREESEYAPTLRGRLLASWARDNPTAAIEWFAANSTRVDRDYIYLIGGSIAGPNPRLAAELTDSIPTDFRGEWMSTVAAYYGDMDPKGALRWVDRYQSSPNYPAVRELVVSSVAASDLPSAVRYVEDGGATINSETVFALTNQWARTDPLAAADWSLKLGDRSQQLAAIDGVTKRWLEERPSDAQEWVLGRPRGDARDQILELILSSPAGAGVLDYDRLVAAFDAKSAADRSIYAAIENALSDLYAPPDLKLADQLLDYFDDPVLRRQAEERTESVK